MPSFSTARNEAYFLVPGFKTGFTYEPWNMSFVLLQVCQRYRYEDDFYSKENYYLNVVLKVIFILFKLNVTETV
jgi:hypothetical protein